MPLQPAAIGIIFDESQTSVLLVKRKDIPIWVLPGGGIDAGETSLEAAIREVREETGFEVIIERQSGEYYPINRLAALTYVYICKIQSGHAILSTETQAIDFFPLNNLPKHFFILHQDWLNDALCSQNMLKKEMTQVTYWAIFKYFFKHPYYLIMYVYGRFFKSK